MQRDKKFLERLYLRTVFPNMIAILGGTVNVLFDGILVGQKLGDIGIASINQSLVVYLLLCTLGSLVAAGASACSAEAIGANRIEEGHTFFSLAVELALLAGGVFCFLGFLASGEIAYFLGSEDSRALVETYIRITFIGGIFKVLLYVPFFYLRLIGRNAHSACAMLLMTVINIVLDYVFMFVWDWGIAGAAWASTIATVAACVLSYYFLFSAKESFRFRLQPFRKKELVSVIRSGSPMASGNLFSALRIVAINAIMNLAGGSSLVAVFAITNSINEFSICIQNGVPQAGSAMLGICHGEKDPISCKELLRLQLKLGSIFSALFSLAVIIFSEHIALLFGTKLDVRIAVMGFAVSLAPATCNSIMTYYYYAIMESGIANLITFLRVFGATVLMAWSLSFYGEFVWLFYLAGEVLTMLLWGAAAGWYSRKKRGRADIYMLDETALQEGKCINFTVACDAEEICQASERITEFCENNNFTAKQSMTISLALEELMIIMADKSMDNRGFLDVRLLRTEGEGILRIRSQGRHFNPLEFAENDMDYMGVGMIMRMAKRTEYQTTLGLNTLMVVI